MDSLITDFGVGKAAEGSCEIGTPPLPKVATTLGDSTWATQDDFPRTFPGGPESAAVDFDLRPGDGTEGLAVQRSQTREATNEVDGLGDKVEEGTPAAETIKADGQPASDTAPGDDTPGGNSGEGAAAAAAEVDGGSEILGPTRTKVMDLEAFGAPLDLDAYKDMFAEVSKEEDAALLARVRDMDEIVVDVVPGGRVLDKRRTYQAAGRSGKKIKIKVRVHYGLNQKQEIEKRYQLNEGGRQPTPKEKRRIQRERVWNLFRMRNILGLDISQQSIAKHTGYSLAWISKLEKEFLASNSSSSEKAVKRNLNRKMTSELVAKAKALIAQKTPIDEIAKELGVSSNTIRNWLKEPGPHAGAKDPPAPKSAASGNSLTTSRRSQSIEPPVVPSDVDFDEDGFVAKALERCGVTKSEKGEWQLAGRRLLDERLRNFSNDDREVLKSAARARVEFRAAADAAEQQLKELLHKIPEVA